MPELFNTKMTQLADAIRESADIDGSTTLSLDDMINEISGLSSAPEYYLCTGVTDTNWTGIKLVKSGDFYALGGDPDSTLTYTTNKPSVNSIYTKDALAEIEVPLDPGMHRLYSCGLNTNRQGGLGYSQENVTEYTGVPTRLDLVQATAYMHTLALDKYGYMWVVGTNSSGQLGVGNTTAKNVFTKSGDKLWKLIAASVNYSMAVDIDGRLWTCGSNSNGRLGTTGTNTGTANTFQDTGLTNIISIDASNSHSVAVDGDGNVYSCGANANGECLTGNTEPVYIWTKMENPTIVGESPTKWVAARCGGNFTILMDDRGKLYSCGLNSSGQLGIGSTTASTSVCEVGSTDEVKAIRYKKISVGNQHVLAIDTDDNLWSWGEGTQGRLGSGSTSDLKLPTQVTGIKCAHIAASYEHSVIIDTDGNLLACGKNSNGQLGLLTLKYISNFVKVGVSKWRGLGNIKRYTSFGFRD